MAIDATLLQAAGSGQPANVGKAQGPYVVTYTLDMAENNLTASDVYTLVPIPAGSVVHGCFLTIETLEDSALTMDVGDGDDPNGYIAAADMTAAKGTHYGYNATLTNKWYAAADTIDIVPSANADTGKIVLEVHMSRPADVSA